MDFGAVSGNITPVTELLENDTSTTNDNNSSDNETNNNNSSNTNGNKSKTNGRRNSKSKNGKPVAKRLESGNRILSLIRKAEQKRVAKKKIIQFLKKKGVSEHKIIEAYQMFYKQEKLYEITFTERPLGFSVIMDTRGKNAVVSSVQDENNVKLGMKVASRMYEINGKRVDDCKHKEILKLITTCDTPFYIVFRESRRNKKKVEKLQKQITNNSEWVDTEDDTSSSDSESESYSSDDDATHVEMHFRRKRQTQKHKKRKKKPKAKDGVLRPSNIQEFDDEALDNEKNEMMKELTRLMYQSTQRPNTTSSNDLKGMTHKRQQTLKLLMDTTIMDENTPTQTHPPTHSQERSLSFGLSELMDQEESTDVDYDPEIFRALENLMGDERSYQDVNRAPHTPSMSMVMTNLWNNQDSMTSQDFGSFSFNSTSQNPHSQFASMSLSNDPYAPTLNDYSQVPSTTNVNYNNNNNPTSIENMQTKSYEPIKDHSTTNVPTTNNGTNVPGEEDEKDPNNVLTTMKSGTTLMKYGRYGRPKYRRFKLSKDHKYLKWFSPKKDESDTKVPIKDILAINIGTDSEVVKKTKDKAIHETSFTIVYGKDPKKTKSLSVTAQSEKEALVWAQGLKILADASKKGANISKLKKLDLDKDRTNEKLNTKRLHARTQSVVINMDKVRSQSVVNLFKSGDSNPKSLLKRHAQLKQQLQKCVDFVMTKANYKIIRSKNEFENVKGVLEDVDVRLRHVKKLLNGEMPDVSSCKADLFTISADLDALKQKLTALVRTQKKL